MSIYWNERTRRLLPYIPGEQPRERKFIKLNTNENPYPPSQKVIDTIKKTADGTLRLYPDPACTEFREAVSERYAVKAEQVFAGNSSDEVLAFAFGAFFGEGSQNSCSEGALLFPDITYSFYPVYAGLWDLHYKTVPLGEDFSLNIEPYLGRSGGIIFPNPNAPTGMALPLGKLRKIAEAAKLNRTVFIIDEAYIAFADREGISSAIPLIDEFPNLLIIRTLSKEASLAGLRVGFAIGSAELIEGLCRMRDSFNSYTLDRIAQAGAAAALKDRAYYDEITRRITATRRRVLAELETLGFTVLPSQANFLFAAPPPCCGKNGLQFFAALKERGILVRHFNKERIDRFLRISIGTDDDMDVLVNICGEILSA